MPDDASYFTVRQRAQIEYRVKDSRFIAHVAPCATRAAAEAAVRAIAREYADATHNCFAYRIGTGDGSEFRVDDAGEPAGTAGRPILQAMETRQVSDAALVVTRYFGGTKLGVGGLIRAYGGAAFAVLQAAALQRVVSTVVMNFEFDYADTGVVHQALHNLQAQIRHTEFDDRVRLTIAVPARDRDYAVQILTDATRGKIVFHEH